MTPSALIHSCQVEKWGVTEYFSLHTVQVNGLPCYVKDLSPVVEVKATACGFNSTLSEDEILAYDDHNWNAPRWVRFSYDHHTPISVIIRQYPLNADTFIIRQCDTFIIRQYLSSYANILLMLIHSKKRQRSLSIPLHPAEKSAPYCLLWDHEINEVCGYNKDVPDQRIRIVCVWVSASWLIRLVAQM